MTNEEIEQTVEKLWQALKRKCCSNPTTAVRIVMLTEKEFKSALRPVIAEENLK